MVDGTSRLSRRTSYPDIVVDGVCLLVTRPCTMVPFTNGRFPEVLSRFNADYGPDMLLEPGTSPETAAERMLDATAEVEQFFAEVLWSDVLDPCLDGLESEIVAVPYRDTIFESAIHSDQRLGWKIEAYLFTDAEAREEIAAIRTAKRDQLTSLRDGVVPTSETREHSLAEIRAKGELFGYPQCCIETFLEERRTRFSILESIGQDRIDEIRRESADGQEMRRAFRDELDARETRLAELNPESRIIEQLEHLDLGSYFDSWSYEELLSFFRRKSGSELPSFFYAFFSEQFYPHRPRCEDAVSLGFEIETELRESHPDLVPLYRTATVLNLVSYLGVDDDSARRRLLTDIGASETDVGSVES